MKISEDFLFHFTPSIQILEKIIQGGFIPFFGTEITEFDDYGQIGMRIESFPRVCFTDLPLNAIKDHKAEYGKYALGMKKEWAMANGLNPVLYIQKNSIVASSLSLVAESIEDLYKTMRTNKESNIRMELLFQRFNNLNNMIGRFAKQYEITKEESDKIKLNGKIIQRQVKRFYDEREWRYIPFKFKNKELHERNLFPALNQKKESLDEISYKYPLKFDLKDIAAIIYPDSIEEILNMLSKYYKVDSESNKN